MPNTQDNLIINTAKKLHENGITDAAAVGEVMALAMEVQDLTVRVQQINGAARSSDIDLEPWNDKNGKRSTFTNNVVKDDSTINLEPWLTGD